MTRAAEYRAMCREGAGLGRGHFNVDRVRPDVDDIIDAEVRNHDSMHPLLAGEHQFDALVEFERDCAGCKRKIGGGDFNRPLRRRGGGCGECAERDKKCEGQCFQRKPFR